MPRIARLRFRHKPGGVDGVSISGVSGTLTHGNTLTIDGSGFGSHADYGGAQSFLVRAWNDFTSTRYTGGWESDGLLNVEANLALTSSSPLGEACTQFIRKQNVNDSPDEQQGCLTTVNVNDPQIYYCSFWYRQSPEGLGGAGTKMARFYYNDESVTLGPGFAGNIYFHPGMDGNATDYETGGNIHRFSGTSAFGGTSAFITAISNTWVFFEFTIYKSGGTTVFGSADYVEWYATIPGFSGTKRQRMFRRGSGLPSNDVSPVEGSAPTNENQRWVDNGTLTNGAHTQGDLGNHMNVAEDVGAYMDFHDAFMNHTIARVIVDESSTFSGLNKPHMQIPTSWSSTQIQVTLNRGQYASLSGKYLYIVNESNQVNANGFLLS